MYKMRIDSKKLDKALRHAPERAKDALQKAINVGAVEFEAIMIEESPIDTGRLRQNIFIKTQRLRAIISPDYKRTPYAEWVSMKGVSPRTRNMFVERTFKQDEEPMRKATAYLDKQVDDILGIKGF